MVLDVIVLIVKVFGSLGLFLYGMKVMGDGLQNAAGSKLQKVLSYMAANRFTAFLTGLIFTSIIQSSSATTVIVVSFVNASLLNLSQAIGVILGANIGTTATAWIVSFLGFKFSIADLAIPAIGIGLPFMFMKAGKRRSIGDIFIGFGILFLGLMFLKNSVPDVKQYPEVLQAIAALSHSGFLSTILFIFIGTIITVIVQSSSAAMAITLTMAASGWIDFPTAAALCLGENIGTTITAQLAAIGANRNSRRAAMAHTLFNVIGVIWVVTLFPIFTGIIDLMMPGQVSDPGAIPLHLSLFHTMFNLTNAFIFIWFVPAYARLIEKILPTKPEDQDLTYKLKYLSASLQDTPEVHYIAVKTEIAKMAQKARDMFTELASLVKEPREKESIQGREKILKLENYIDQMQEEISRYIAHCLQDRPSEESSRNLGSLMKVVDDLENIGDSTERLANILRKSHEKKIAFPKANIDGVEPFIAEVSKGLALIYTLIGTGINDETFAQVKAVENRIDEYRSDLKKAARKRIQGGAEVKMEILFIDMLEELEKIGDYILEIGKELKLVKD